MVYSADFLGAPGKAISTSVVNGVRLSTCMMPAMGAARGGDWADAFAVNEDVIALSIGDICGHGVQSITAMVATREAIRSAALAGLGPSQVLVEVNRFFCRRYRDTYSTALLAMFNIRKQTLSFANAGHPPLLIAGPAGTAFLEFPDSDLPLGITPDLEPKLRLISVPASTLLVLYTDGVTEHERQSLLGGAELRDAASTAYRSAASVPASVIEQQMLLANSNRDDIAIVTAQTPAASAMRNRREDDPTRSWHVTSRH